MALIFKAFQSNVANKNGEKLWYPRVITVGKTISTRQIAGDIAQLSALSSGDVFNTLHSLATVMKTYLQESHSVKLDGIGTFSLRSRASGNGVAGEKEVSSTQINTIVCQFTPEHTRNADGSIATRALVQGVTFVKLASLVDDEDDATGDSSDTGDDNTGSGDDTGDGTGDDNTSSGSGESNPL